MSNAPFDKWTIGRAEDLYGIRDWGKGYFGINPAGHVAVFPSKDPARSIDLRLLIDDLRKQGIHPPLLLRFPEILQHRLTDLNDAFQSAIQECSYQGQYRCVYPIKVNQSRHVVEEILRFGRGLGFGLEAGSKAELLAVLALVDDDQTPIVCNGFKDSEYVETVVMAQKLGRHILPVMENAREVGQLIESAERNKVQLQLGVRVKLASRGSGKWETSSGAGSKFGFTVDGLLTVLRQLQEHGSSDRLKLLHFHLGSQITNIRNIKAAINEAARVFVELVHAGAGLEYLDVGGGLGIDYDGSQTTFGSSMNYNLREYAADVVHGIQSVCDQAKVPHPTIVSESGRAVAAFYSVLAFDVVGYSEVVPAGPVDRPAGQLSPPLSDLFDALNDLSQKNFQEAYHDAVKAIEDALNLFNLGYLSLEQRNLAERLFWRVCKEVHRLAQRADYVHEDLKNLDAMLADVFFCNFSVFQSMPDSWAVQQLFPMMPLERLNERPDKRATLADLTCDSDGRIDRFIDKRDVKKVLEVHDPGTGPYYMGAFLVGAYQEILGDLHNLFGDTHAVHISLGEDGKPVVDTIVQGNRVRDVLAFVQYEPAELAGRMKAEVARAIRQQRLTAAEGDRLIRFYQAGLDGYTYLEG